MDMRKEYRAELSRLKQSERKLTKDLNNHLRKCTYEIKRIDRSSERARKLIERSGVKARKCVQRDLDRISRRRAILEGRLS